MKVGLTPDSGKRGSWHRMRSYLTSMHFRYKIAAYIFGAMLFAGIMQTGLFWNTTQQYSKQIELSTEARAEVAKMSRDLHASVLTAELRSELNDETFVQLFEERSAEINAQYEEELRQAADVAQKQLQGQKQIFWWWLVGYIFITIVVVFCSILLSRWIASPMQEIQKTLEEISRGKLAKPKALEGSGEFQALHVSSVGMVGALRTEKEHILSECKSAVIELKSPIPQKGIERLERLLEVWEEQLNEPM